MTLPSQNAIAALLVFAVLSDTPALLAQQRISSEPQSPSFSGIWVELRPASGPAMRLRLTQTRSQVQVRLSYRDSFPDRVFGVATLEDDRATWTAPMSCAVQFRSLGYNYDNPGIDTVALSLGKPIVVGDLRPSLLYIQEFQWNAPCGGHPIGTERIQKILTRQ
jgi:hypothetical protein